MDAVLRAYFSGSRRDAYGGTYLDEQGRTVVLVTRDIAGIRAELVARVGDETDLVVGAARFALTDLDRVVDRLTRGLASLRDEGAAVATVAIDEQANRVWVGLETDSAAARAAVLTMLDPSERGTILFGTSGPNVLE